MMQRPPTSPLFPYTTLFRSQWRAVFTGIVEQSVAIVNVADGPRFKRMVIDGVSLTVADRKSTRLNSSHRCISYAVFCLKKKKKKQQLLAQAKSSQDSNPHPI